MSEFIAHPHAGNAITATDRNNEYLITGDSDGAIKVWYIKNYLTSVPEQAINESPMLHATWHRHGDAINCIDICSRNNRMLVITSSSDCSVSLSDIDGNHIGEFGQDNHWKIDAAPESKIIEEEAEEIEEVAEDTEEEELDPISLGESVEDFVYDPEFRVSTWDTTVLGKAYKETRLQKRERKQPGTVPGYKEHIEESAVGPYGILEYNELGQMPVMKKPDFMLHPHKYFGEKPAGQSGKKKDIPEAPMIQEARTMLRAAFDERSLFPRELLDFEAQVRNEHAQKQRHLERKGRVEFGGANILNSSTNSNTGSKMGSRIGSSIQDRRTTKRIPSTTTFSTIVSGKMSSFSKTG